MVDISVDSGLIWAIIVLIGTIIGAVLNTAFFEPRKERKERLLQKTEAKEALRKALYNEMAFVYNNIKTSRNYYKKADEEGQKELTYHISTIKHLATCDVYQKARAESLLLFYELKDALAIDAFYWWVKAINNEFAINIVSESNTAQGTITGKKLVEILNKNLQAIEEWIYSGLIDCNLLKNSAYMFTALKELECPPSALVELVENKTVGPCKTIDLGCGSAGNYATYLAYLGFDVTGVHSSPTVIKSAEENAEKRGVTCTFLVADALSELHEVTETFDFAYDWGLLHYMSLEQQKKYVTSVHRLLNPQGKFFSVCFSEKVSQFDGAGKYRKTLGTTYFSSEDEVRNLFDPYFTIINLKTIEISGNFVSHLAHYIFMERK